MHENLCVSNIDISRGLTVHHIQQVYTLWSKILLIYLDDNIVLLRGTSWMELREYSSSAYMFQFEDSASISMNPSYDLEQLCSCQVQVFFFAWLIKNRAWISDRLQVRVWTIVECANFTGDNQKLHVTFFFKSRYSMRIWKALKNWIGVPELNMENWPTSIRWRIGGRYHPHAGA
jgi:hypothetical protein